jgi:hypothetical protein
MKIRLVQPASAFTIIETLVYLGAVALVLAMAFMTFYRTEENNRNLSRNADDILRALRVGEQWRADVRRAVAPIKAGGQELVITQATNVVSYVLTNGSVWRRSGARSVEVLPGVVSSKMERDPRESVVAWRWDLELKGRQRVVRVKPLFSFAAVAGKESR